MISSILYELPDLLHHLDAAGTIIILVGSNVIFFLPFMSIEIV